MSGWHAEDRDPVDGSIDLDDALLDLLLDAPDPQLVPAGYRHLADMFGALRGPASAAEVAGEAEAVAQFRAARTADDRSPCLPLRRGRTTRRAMVVTAATVALFSAAGAAAAAGALPGKLQDVASELVSKVGISVPMATGGHRPAELEPALVEHALVSLTTESSLGSPGPTPVFMTDSPRDAQPRLSLVPTAPPTVIHDEPPSTTPPPDEEPFPAEAPTSTAAEPIGDSTQPVGASSAAPAPVTTDPPVSGDEQPPLTPAVPTNTRPNQPVPGPPSCAPGGPPVVPGPPSSVPGGPPVVPGPPSSVPGGPPVVPGPPSSVPADLPAATVSDGVPPGRHE